MNIDRDELQGRVAIVTGAGQGMGLAVAERLASAGATIVLNDVNEEAVDRAVRLISNQTPAADPIGVVGDVTVKSDVGRIVTQAIERFGEISVLVNNAGVLRPTKVIDIPEEEWDWVVAVNLKGTFLCSQAVLPYMRRIG